MSIKCARVPFVVVPNVRSRSFSNFPEASRVFQARVRLSRVHARTYAMLGLCTLNQCSYAHGFQSPYVTSLVHSCLISLGLRTVWDLIDYPWAMLRSLNLGKFCGSIFGGDTLPHSILQRPRCDFFEFFNFFLELPKHVFTFPASF